MSQAGITRFLCNCGGRLKVNETRSTEDAIYRTRKCVVCGFLYTTEEKAIEGVIPKEARNLSRKKHD